MRRDQALTGRMHGPVGQEALGMLSRCEVRQTMPVTMVK